jgi:hypothetical protein
MERYRTTIILVVVLAALAGVAYFLNQSGISGTANSLGTPTAAPPKYVWQSTEPVVSLDVVSATNRVSLRKDVTTTIWSLIAPIKGEADPYGVGSEADALQNLQALSVLTNATDLAGFGLDKPLMQVVAVLGNAKPVTHTISIGKASIDGAGYFVKQPDNPSVYLVANTTIEPLKTWFVTPPKAPPTPTPLPITVAPTHTITATNTLTVTLPVSGTATGPATSPITTTGPGAANATTPAASPTTSK